MYPLSNIHGDVLTSNLDINVATIGNNTALACPTGKKLFIHGLVMGTDIACVIRINNGATTIGTFNLGALGSVNLSDVSGMPGQPIIDLAYGNSLVLNASTAARISGMIKYSYVELN